MIERVNLPRHKAKLSIGASLGLCALACLLLIPAKERETPLSEKLVRHIKERCVDDSPCIISLQEALGFAWDKLYFFPDAVGQSGQALGADDGGARRRYDGAIACLLQGETVASQLIDRTDAIWFSWEGEQKSLSISAERPLVVVKREARPDGYLYVLTPLPAGAAPTRSER